MMNQYNNNSLIIPPRNNITIDEDESVPASDLRGLKDQINQFIPRPSQRPPSSNNNQLPILPKINSLLQPQNYDSYTESDSGEQNRFTGSYNLPSVVSNKNYSNQQEHEPVYSITSSFRQQQLNNNNIQQIPPQISTSIENIYSKVLTVAKKQNSQHQDNFDNDEQPLYMNTDSYDFQAANQQRQQPQNTKPAQPSFGNWNDSSV